MEATTPPKSLPDKQEIFSFQRTWIRRAGAAGVFGAFLVAASLVVQRIGLSVPSGNSNADEFVFVHHHSTRIIYSSILQGIGFAMFLGPLLFLFRSAVFRAARMRNGFIGLIVVGPVFFGLGLAISAVGSSQAADKFVKQEPAVVQQARQHAEAQASSSSQPKQGQSKSSTGTAASTTTKAQATTASTTATTATGSTTTGTGTTTTAAKPPTPDQAASTARENLADHLNKHTTVLIIGGLISTIGVLALVFGMIYTNLWAMRTGLVTRFWGALGMAFGLFLIIPLIPPIPALVLWFAVLGLMFLGLWPRPLPPAWEAGEAIPWQRAGDDLGPPPADRGRSGTVEGSGREVSETPLPENGDGGGESGEALDPHGQTQGQRRKKRKRRG